MRHFPSIAPAAFHEQLKRAVEVLLRDAAVLDAAFCGASSQAETSCSDVDAAAAPCDQFVLATCCYQEGSCVLQTSDRAVGSSSISNWWFYAQKLHTFISAHLDPKSSAASRTCKHVVGAS